MSGAASERLQALRGARSLTIATLCAKLLGFAAQLVLARLLAPGEFGLYVFAIGITTIATRLASFDARRDVLRCAGQQAAPRARAYLLVQALLGLLLAVLLAAAGPAMADALARFGSLLGANDSATAASPLVAALALLPLSESLRAPLTALLERELRFGFLARLELAGTVLQASLWIGLAAWGAGAWALVAGAYGASLLRLLLAASFAWPLLRRVRAGRADYRSVCRFGGTLWLMSLLAALFWSGKDVLAGAGLGLAMAGLFGMAFEIPRALLQVAEGWNRVGLALLGRSDVERQRRVAALIVRASAALLGPAFVVGTVHAEFVLRLCFGARWLPAAPALRIFMLMVVCEGTLRVWADLASTRGRPDLPLRASATSAIALPCFAFFGLDYGLPGLALAVLAAWALPMPFALAWAQRELGASFLQWLRPALLASALAIGVALVGKACVASVPGPWAEMGVIALELSSFVLVILRSDAELAGILRQALLRRRLA